MAPLIPQQRMDKNGKLVTRHVRSETPAASVHTQLPSPAVVPMTPVQTPREAATAAWKRLESAGMKFSSGVIPNLEYLVSESPELFHTVVDRYVQEAGVSEGALWQGMITFTNLTPREDERGLGDAEEHLSQYRNGLLFFEYYGRLTPYVSGRTLDYQQRMVSFLHRTDEMVPEHLRYLDHDAAKAVLLVMRVAELRGTANWDEDFVGHDVDDKLQDIEVLARNMKRVEPILEGLLEMQATDSGAVETLLNTQSSLRDGAL